jgi:hypothetical protein
VLRLLLHKYDDVCCLAVLREKQRETLKPTRWGKGVGVVVSKSSQEVYGTETFQNFSHGMTQHIYLSFPLSLKLFGIPHLPLQRFASSYIFLFFYIPIYSFIFFFKENKKEYIDV